MLTVLHEERWVEALVAHKHWHSQVGSNDSFSMVLILNTPCNAPKYTPAVFPSLWCAKT